MSLDPGPLYIKTYAGDNGTTRPLPANTSQPFWESPSLYLGSPMDHVPPNVGAYDATVNIAKQIWVWVDNMSEVDRQNVCVQLWVANPTVGLQPGNHVPSIVNPTQVFPLGTVPANGQAGFSVQWTPAQADLGADAEADRCIGANCFVSDGPTTTEGQQLTSPPSGHPFDARLYQHNAQRNLTLHKAPAGGKAHFLFDVANVGGEDADYTLTVEEVVGEDSFDRLGREQVLLTRATTVTEVDLIELARLRTQYSCGQLGQPIERALLAAGHAVVLVDSAGTYKVTAATARARRIILDPASLERTDTDVRRTSREQEVRVRVPAERVGPLTLDVTMDEDTKIGGIHTFQVKQYDDGGTLVGGIRFMALAVSDELLDPCQGVTA